MNPILTSRTAELWLDEYHILHLKALPNAEVTLADSQENTVVSLKLLQQVEKAALLADIRLLKSFSQEAEMYSANSLTSTFIASGMAQHVSFVEMYSANGLTSTFIASAVLINSPLNRMIANFIMKINKPTIPTRLFTDENEAVTWLKRFTQKED